MEDKIVKAWFWVCAIWMAVIAIPVIAIATIVVFIIDTIKGGLRYAMDCCEVIDAFHDARDDLSKLYKEL